MVEEYYSLEELLDMVDGPNRSLCKKIYVDNQTMFEKAMGSSVKHQAWVGGYLGHLRDCMNIAVRLYENLGECRQLPFSLSDSLLVLYLHDLEKAWKYGGGDKEKEEIRSITDYQEFVRSKLEVYGFQLTAEHWNGLKYVHGEGGDYDPKVRIQNPLAAFVHCCDTISARIWFDFPEKETDW